MKAVLKPDHIPLNNFELIVVGLPPLTPISISDLEEVLDVVDLPDRTKASGGRTQAVEFDLVLATHHLVEQAAMELWFQECQDPVSPLYKKVGTLLLPSISGNTVRSYSLDGLFITKRGIAGSEMDNDGELHTITWGMSVDDVLPL